MNNNILGTNVITQIAIIVENIDKTSQAYADLLDVKKPPVNLTDTIDTAKTEFRGKKSTARAKLAFFDMGSVQLELIEPDDQPSTWREALDKHGEGVHHIAFVVDDMQTVVNRLDSKGMSLIQKGEYPGGRYSYVDTSNELKVLFELLENDN